MIETADEFVQLRSSSHPQECRRAAVEEAPTQVWMEVVDRYPEERVAVVQNKTVPLTVLDILIDDPDTHVRFMVAMKRKLSPDLLERLAHDVDESIRMRVAQHRNTSRETLESLRHDPWSEIRAAVDDRLIFRSGDYIVQIYANDHPEPHGAPQGQGLQHTDRAEWQAASSESRTDECPAEDRRREQESDPQ